MLIAQYFVHVFVLSIWLELSSIGNPSVSEVQMFCFCEGLVI